MKELLEPISKWLGGNWGWIVLIGYFVEISPIKINPITAILNWIGKRLTGDIWKALREFRREFDEWQMDSTRTEILGFSDSLIEGKKHTREEFEHIIDLNKKYEKLVEKYEVKNDVYKEAYEYIVRVYRRRLDRRDFLTVPKVGYEGGVLDAEAS